MTVESAAISSVFRCRNIGVSSERLPNIIADVASDLYQDCDRVWLRRLDSRTGHDRRAFRLSMDGATKTSDAAATRASSSKRQRV